ncbi:DUF971 domain-containing protein [Stieleria varia]|uniref:Gamma-butyrobetaine hydroxylase-like N-terminal domain-containing protein n=1 Tax=Stieleria varia TaxID=2528005 RepID=A0A5C6A5E5_9BACT|nr:DUF971 domain-containing protein [Stieleria varia]TWT94656.1 hypothetical protein Pla52n_54770 [Stieleria varia]
MPTPQSIQRDGPSAIIIHWTDDKTTRWTAAELRKRCPCATCREKKRSKETGTDASEPAAKSIGLPVLTMQETLPLTITAMRPVGTYAYNIAFSDGHSSGLFQLGMLYEQV